MATVGIAQANGWQNLYGFIDQTGKEVIGPQFLRAGSFSDGLANVGYNKAGTSMPVSGYIDKSGQLVLKDLGLINHEGQLVTAPVFSEVKEISDGYAYVNHGGVRVDYVSGYDGNASPVVETALQGGRWGYVKLTSRQQ